MTVELVSVTTLNDALHSIHTLGPIHTINNGQGTPQENLVEWAARNCYDSQDKMGTAEGFVQKVVGYGHLDVVEHVVVTVSDDGGEHYGDLRQFNRHCETSWDTVNDDGYVISGNLSVWLDLFQQGILTEAVPILKAIAPSVFSEFDGEPAFGVQQRNPSLNVLQWTDGWGQGVTLLGANIPHEDDLHDHPAHGAATFLFEGISLACTHQLVRHRLGSYSQLSRRYVDIKKGDWDMVVPPSIRDNFEALEQFLRLRQDIEETYRALRNMGIKKEDARSILPVATTTRIVVTMNFEAWRHFLWLRALDKAAQPEIRSIAGEVLNQLHAIAPQVFQAEKDESRGEAVESIASI